MYITNSLTCNNRPTFVTINNHKHYSNPLTFEGELEVKFFKAVMDGNKREQLSILNNIGFDIFEKDQVTGNNFLHVACKDGSQAFLEKALKLLRINKTKIDEILNVVNKDNKVPFDYTKNENFKRTVYAILGKEPTVQPSKNIGNEVSTEIKEIPQVDAKPKVGNEVDEPIDVSGFSFGVEEEISNIAQPSIQKGSILLEKKKGLNAVVGLTAAKKILNDEIVKPIINQRNVFTNGFLLHGFSGDGKTYLVEKLAEELNRKIVEASLLISSQSDAAKLQEIIDKSIIRINPDEIREVSLVSEILKNYFAKTGKQGIVFMDEIQKFFPANNQFINNIRAMQSIENSAKRGMVLIATTNDKNMLDPNLINALRFERLIELKPPQKEDILELIRNNISSQVTLSVEEMESLSKKMNGLSFNDISRIIEGTCNKFEKPNFKNFTDELNSYARLHNIQDLTDEGTTSNYDTYLKRNKHSINDPKSLDDVIGMNEVKIKLKKIFNPLKRESLLKDFYKDNSIKKPNGILLYGPPGCGKTFIMNALAAETGLPLYQVKISDVGSSYYNETEKNIKKIFDQLRKKYRETGEPSILFFDECDSVFSKSADLNNQKVLNTLKEEMNNAGDDGIYIVAATNEKDNLNTAIIRDGRFDTKIEVGYPDEEARIGLISKALNCPALIHNKIDANIKELAKLTEGLSNASISGIFSNLKYEKASEIADTVTSSREIDEFLSKSPIEYDKIKASITSKKEEINKMKLKQKSTSGLEWQQKTAAYDEFKDRTYYTANDPKSLDDVIGMDDVKEQMKLKVLAPLNPILRKHYEENHIPTSSGIILHGPGGVGKTFIIKAVAAESKIPLYELNLSEQGSGIMNETAKNIKNIFNQLKRKYKETGEPSILLLDECDSLLGKVANNGSDAAADRTNIVNALKEELANASDNGIVVIAATNNYKNLDQNVIRSGRFNDHIKIDYPDEVARLAYITKLLQSRNLSERIATNKANIDKLVSMTDQMSNADIKAIIDNAVILSEKDFVNKILKTFKSENVSQIGEIKTKDLTFEELEKSAIKKQQELAGQRHKEQHIFLGGLGENNSN